MKGDPARDQGPGSRIYLLFIWAASALRRMAPPQESVNSSLDEDEQHEVQIVMIQILYAVVVGLALASTASLIGLPDWAAPLSYVIGMGVTLLGRGPASFASATPSDFSTRHDRSPSSRGRSYRSLAQ